MEVQFLHQYLPQLPEQLIGEIIQYLDSDHIQFLLKVANLRQTIINEVYAREVHFVLSPTRRPHPCSSRSDLIDFTTFADADDFLLENPDINPRTVAVITHGDFSSLRSLFEKHAERFEKHIQRVEVLIESYNLTSEELDFVLSIPHLTKLQVGGITLGLCGDSLAQNLQKCISLDQLVILGHQIRDWSRVVFPLSVTVLDISWNPNTDISTMTFPPHIRDLFLNRSGIDDNLLMSMKFPKSLKTLQLTHNKLKKLSVSHLPPSLETLDLSSNTISNIVGSWPPYLKTILLHGNALNDKSFDSMASWPQNLQRLRLDVNQIHFLSSLKSLPADLHYLDLSQNHFTRLEVANSAPYPYFVFPRNLKTLFLTGNDRFKYTNLVNRIEFPSTLTKLNMDGCNISSLEHFKFPENLTSLSISGNRIDNICTYNGNGVDWTQLNHLLKLELVYNRIKTLQEWVPPKNLQSLNLSENNLTELNSVKTPLFQGIDVSLTSLVLDENYISRIGDVKFPRSLQTISLENNLLTGLLNLTPFSGIREVFLKGNTITGILCDRLPGTAKITTLDLTQNEILRTSKDKEKVNEFFETLEKCFGKAVVRRKFNLNSVHTFQ